MNFRKFENFRRYSALKIARGIKKFFFVDFEGKEYADNDDANDFSQRWSFVKIEKLFFYVPLVMVHYKIFGSLTCQ